MKTQFVKTINGDIVDITGCLISCNRTSIYAYHMESDENGPDVELFSGTESECQEYIAVLARDLAAREWNSELKQFVIVAGIGEATC